MSEEERGHTHVMRSSADRYANEVVGGVVDHARVTFAVLLIIRIR